MAIIRLILVRDKAVLVTQVPIMQPADSLLFVFKFSFLTAGAQV
jgi:hypothetical protein